ncbi:flagellin [Zavarzinia sp. CC-PAN008]|uniref:flagellin n=1 Tax=Zavarzinia sp. CC-PAN008 TaxID=3243332 RepID=UPI003F746E23
MTRVASFGASQVMIADIMRQQARLNTTQSQVSTGKVSATFEGLGSDAQAALNARSLQAKVTQYAKQAVKADDQMEIHEQYLQQLRKATNTLRTQLGSAVGVNDATTVQTAMDTAFQTIVSVLNGKVDGKYVFGGTRTDTQPLALTSLAGLDALPPGLPGVFQNGDTRLSVQVDDSLTVSYGELASDVGSGLMSIMQALVEYNSGTTPGGIAYGQGMPDAQRAFLQGIMNQLEQVDAGLVQSVSALGATRTLVADTEARQKSISLTVGLVISDIEDVDAAEAITRLNQDQVALQTSYKVVGQLASVSLLNFL